MNTQALLLAVICGTITCATAAPDPQANPTSTTSNRSIATVDMQELFKHYYRTREAQQQINIERTRIQKDNNERLARIREIEASLANLHRQIDDPSVADSRKQTLSREFNAQQQDFAALDRERREFLQRRNQALNVSSNGRNRAARMKP